MQAAQTFRSRASIDHCRGCERRRQKIMRHARTFRERGSLTAHDTVGVKAVQIRSLAVPSNVQPGQPFDVSAIVKNTASIRAISDVDACGNGANQCNNPPSGQQGTGETCVQIEFQMLFDGGKESERTNPTCIPGSLLAASEQELEATFEAPDNPQTVEIFARIVLPGSGRESGQLRDEVPVSRQEKEEEEPRKDPAGAEPTNGNGNGGGLFGQFSNILILMIVLVVGATVLRGQQ